MKALFITATGTGLGKTLITAALAHQIRQKGEEVRVLKPLVTGFDADEMTGSDPAILLRAAGQAVDDKAIERLSPFRFAAPLAPLEAAAKEGRHLSFDKVLEFCRRTVAESSATLLIEGLGGAFVPLGGGRTIAELIAALDIPALVIGGSYVGCQSHMIATCRALEGAGVSCTAILVNRQPADGPPVAETAAALGPCCGALPILTVGRLSGPGPLWEQVPDLTKALRLGEHLV